MCTDRLHGAVYSDSGYALSLTQTHAIVWPYAAHISSPETFTFAIPQPSKHKTDSLPLGSLVSASASSTEPGLVIVIPTTGKITYWESIASAATLNLKLQRNGVDLTIPGMLSGEKVIQILNAESAGFMLAFSSGRIAYMTVRDGQGRPAITVQFLRSGNGTANTGIFGSLRNALSSSSWHGDIAAIRAGRQEKIGERNVVVATKKGKLQSWNMHRGGHTSLVAESEGRETIVLAIKEAIPAFNSLFTETFELLDVAHIQDSLTETALIPLGDTRTRWSTGWQHSSY
jgi:nuclear pore complex protein Nup133